MSYVQDPYDAPITQPPQNTDSTEPNITEETDPPTEPTEPPTVEYLINNDNKYVGCYINELNETDVFEGSLNMIGWFDSFDKISSTKLSLCLDEHQHIAFITLEPNGMSLEGIVNGAYDDLIIAYLSELSKGDRIHTELFVRLMHEMEMRPAYSTPWYIWQGWNPELYIQAWQHIVSMGREICPNVKWVWSPNRADKYTTDYYPGDEWVDYVGMSLNNTVKKYTNFKDFYEIVGTREALEAYGKPIILSEVAEHNFGTELQGDYLISVLDWVKNDDNCIGVVFFNKNVTSDRRYQFTDNEAIMKRFVQSAKELLEFEKEIF